MADPQNPQQPVNPLSLIGQPTALDRATSGVSNVIGNPMLQGALAAYLGTMGSPRYLGWGNAAMQGGLQGLNAFNQARQTQLATPLLQAKGAQAMIQAQQAMPMQGMPAEILDVYNQALASAKDPLERAQLQSIMSRGRSGLMNYQEMQNQLSDVIAGRAKTAKATMDEAIAPLIPALLQKVGMQLPGTGVTVPAVGGAAPAAGTAAPSPGGPAGVEARPAPGVVFDLPITGKGVVKGRFTAEGKEEYSLDNGATWQPLS